MPDRVLVFYGSYRSDRMGIRLADFIVARLRARGADVELIDAKAVGLPMLDRMYKEYAPGAAPPAMAALASKIKAADAFVFVTGEYNWGMQPGLKNLTDHFLEEWFWRPAAIASYSSGRLSGVRSGTTWHGTLSEMGMVVVSSTIAVGHDQRDAQCRCRAHGRSGRGARAGVSALRRRSRLVDAGGQGAARHQGSALLIFGGCQAVFIGERAFMQCIWPPTEIHMEFLCTRVDLIACRRWAMEYKAKSTTPAKIAMRQVYPLPALHPFALARAHELRLLAERCSSPIDELHATHGLWPWLRMRFRRNFP